MRKIILVLSVIALVPAVYVAVAHAEEDEEIVETRNVGQRMSCTEIQSEMDSLAATEDLDEEGVARLEKLKSDYRNKCMKRATGRKTGRAKVQLVQVQDVVPQDETQTETKQADGQSGCDNPDKNGCCPGETYTDLGDQGWNCCTENNEHCFPPMEIQKDFSLCDDGTNPDKNGCCAGETYTDLKDLGWNCCMADGVTCFPPIKK